MLEGGVQYKAAKTLKPKGTKMVGACGFEPQTPTVSISESKCDEGASSDPK
jgi:hypothetical protein